MLDLLPDKGYVSSQNVANLNQVLLYLSIFIRIMSFCTQKAKTCLFVYLAATKNYLDI